jgi:hypothetical protein
VCCGTKRLVEIRCPSDCPYLASSRSHPPAIARRQHERDARFLGPLVADLSQPQLAVLMMLQDFVRTYRPTAMPRLTDRDVGDAANALASTYETEMRGILYEHQPAALQAARLSRELHAFVEKIKKEGGPALGSAAPAALRAIHRAAQDAGKSLDGGETAYLDLIDRITAARAEANEASGVTSEPADQGSRLILP